ncbi:hypothetical protein SISNIDRAFT_444355 [Sistotremastrum niveocremeum HHB9708]|uniref:NAD(P)-binding protein n=1 Tax=Sistotremastrum niveocremeum HHB9708 TaxID=1314777 RepID=A0A164QXJ5_9AGAM|nr:hypothetical protein SISNIDRAFT_444355 [Sistotremastrum niveocremeum HHB9708]
MGSRPPAYAIQARSFHDVSQIGSDEAPGGDFNVLFIGAGNVVFGTTEGPWNHSLRFERKLGDRLKVVAVVDPDITRAKKAIEAKSNTSAKVSYEQTKVFRTVEEFATAMLSKDTPRIILVGVPPAFRGSTLPGHNLEQQVLKHLPGIPMFVEKPVATGPVSRTLVVSQEIGKAGTLCGVGYMLRYLQAVQKMKRIIKEHDLRVMATITRYAAAYESISVDHWWDKSRSCGPIIEQATHVADLSRYFAGEVDLKTVRAQTLDWDEEPGFLSEIPINESKIKEDNRIPRVTASTWKYQSGAVGSLIHLAVLQGTDYSCEFEVYADGYLFKLVNPYVKPTLYIRRPGNDIEEVYTFADDDPFYTEVSNFVDVIESGDKRKESNIFSTYADACKTYEFTWAIREAGERSRAKRKARALWESELDESSR